MAVEFDTCNVVVTGGTGALGTAVVTALIAAGATCHVPNLVRAELDAWPHSNDARVRIMEGVDLADDAAVRGFYLQAPPLWASLHLAGGFAMGPIGGTSAEAFMQQLRMNAVSCFLCCREAVASIRRRSDMGDGGLRGGRIVNVAARPALEPRLGSGMAAYTAAKAAVAAMTVSLAEELAPEGIWVNAVAPSILDTPANRAAMPAAPHDRWPSLADVAAVIAHLASPSNRCTRGAVVPVYGRV